MGAAVSERAAVAGAAVAGAAVTGPRRRGWPDVPRTVWALAALHVASLLAWALLVPAYAGPREAAQVDLVLRATEDPFAASPASRPLAPDVAAAVARYDFFGDESLRLRAGAAQPRGERPSFDELARRADGSAVEALAGVGAAEVHARPPAHTLLGAAWLGLVPGSQGWAHDRQVLHLRLLNVLLLAGLPLLLHGAAVRLGARPTEAVAAAALALAVPMLSHIGASVSADGLLVLAAGVCALAGAEALTRGLSRGAGAALGLGAAVALLTSGLGFVLAGWALLVVVVAVRRSDRGSSRVHAAGLALGGVAVGAAWWAQAGGGVALLVGRPPTGPSWLEAAQGVVGNLPVPIVAILGQSTEPVLGHLITSTFGAFGFLRVPFLLPVAVVAALLVAGGVVAALVLVPDGVPGGRARTERALLVVPVLLLVVLVAGIALPADEPYALAEGRFLLPGIVLILPVSAIGLGALLGARGRPWLPVLVLAAALAAQAHALALAIGTSWGPTGGPLGWAAAWQAWVPVWAGSALLPLLLATGALAVLGPPLVGAPLLQLRADGLPSRWRVVAGANVAALVVTFGVLEAARRAGISGDELVRDTIAVGGGQIYAGLLSNLGVIVWAVGAGSCILAGVALRRRPRAHRHARLLLGVGALTAVLATDDLILLHEGGGLGPQVLGIPEVVILGAYAAAAVVLAVAHRDLLPTLRGRTVLLLAFACFGVSQGVDLFDERLLHVVTEDVVKLLGIVNWTVGWGLAATGVLRDELSAQTPSASSKPTPHSRSRSLEE